MAKMLRANVLLAEIDQLALQFMFHNRPTFDVVADRLNCRYTVTAHVPAPPLAIAVMFGEVLHNLRSSLDHVARLLVLSDGRVPVDKSPHATAFPILLKPPKKELTIFPRVHPEALAAVELSI